LWVIIITVFPWLLSSFKIFKIFIPDSLSKFPVGSSAKTNAGSCTSALAIATLCCWPPESSLGRWLNLSPSPTCSKTSPAFSSLSDLEIP
jgi:hypothetical protein